MPSTFSMKAMNAIHRAMIAVTGGRAGWNLRGMPVVELTTTGLRSGEPRTSMLTSPLRIHGDEVVVASRGGDDAQQRRRDIGQHGRPGNGENAAMGDSEGRHGGRFIFRAAR